MTVSVLDVGQGLSVLVETQNHRLLYDVGSSWGDSSMVTQVVWPVLQSKRIDRLDKLVVSHNDNDHAGGVEHLLGLAEVEKITAGEKQSYSHKSLSNCHQQSPWQWDGVEFSFIHYPDGYKNSANNASCILLINSNGFRVLIPGDIESAVEKVVSKSHSKTLQSNLLIAPHHGSISSSSWLFLRRVDPAKVIFSTAYGNRFNHPHPRVSSRYRALDISSYNTAKLGAIMFHVEKGTASELVYQRQKHRYFWQH